MYRTLKTLPCLSQIDSLHKRGQKKEKNRMTETQRQTNTVRQTDIKTDRQTDPMLDTDKQRDRPANGYTERQTAYATIKVKCGSTTKSS